MYSTRSRLVPQPMQGGIFERRLTCGFAGTVLLGARRHAFRAQAAVHVRMSSSFVCATSTQRPASYPVRKAHPKNDAPTMCRRPAPCRRVAGTNKEPTETSRTPVYRRGRFIVLPSGWSIVRTMRGLFSQIVIGVIVTVIGTLVTDAITGSDMSRHFVPGAHGSWRGH